jgi:hypothetical protein
VVLKGFAKGARLTLPLVLATDFEEVVAGFGVGCFLVVVSAAVSVTVSVVAMDSVVLVSVACEAGPVERVTKTVVRSSVVAMRRNNIYCTPMGFRALSG